MFIFDEKILLAVCKHTDELVRVFVGLKCCSLLHLKLTS